MIGLCEYCGLKYADCKGNKSLEKTKCDYYKKPIVMNVKELAERVAELEAEVEALRKANQIIHEELSAEAVSREEYEETDGVVKIEKQNANEVGEIKHIVIHSPNYTRYFYNESMEIEVPSADAVPQLRQTDTLIIADALRYLAKDTERHLVDRTRADALRQQFLKYGASMCKGGAE